MIYRAKYSAMTSLLAVVLTLGACGMGGGDPMADAEAAFADNDYRSARIHLLAALKENSADPEANLLFAKTQLRLGDGVAAEAALKKLSGNQKYAAEIPNLMAHALLLRDMPERALELTDNPDPAHASLANWVKAQALLQLDRKEDAWQPCLLVLRHLPMIPLCWPCVAIMKLTAAISAQPAKRLRSRCNTALIISMRFCYPANLR